MRGDSEVSHLVEEGDHDVVSVFFVVLHCGDCGEESGEIAEGREGAGERHSSE